MSVLVTGGLGFLGINVVRALAHSGADVVALDRTDPDDTAHAFLVGLDDHVTYCRADITANGLADVTELTQIDEVIHAAAVTLVGPEEEWAGAELAARVNVGGTASVVSWAVDAGVRRIVHVSSAAVYGPALDQASIDEAIPPAPDTVYGITKLAGELVARRLADIARMELVVARLSHLYGPMERRTNSRQTLSPVHGWIDALARGGVLRTGTPGLARDYLYVGDAAEALMAMLRAPLGPDRVFHVASGSPLTDLAALESLRQLDTSISIQVSGGGEVRSRPPLATERIRTWIGWTPRRALSEGCREYLEWFSHRLSQGAVVS